MSPANPTVKTQGADQPLRGSLSICRREAESAGGTPGDIQNITVQGDLQRQALRELFPRACCAGGLPLPCGGWGHLRHLSGHTTLWPSLTGLQTQLKMLSTFRFECLDHEYQLLLFTQRAGAWRLKE